MKSLYFKPSLAVLFWGVSFIATKSLLDELTPLTVIYLRLFLGAIFIGAVAVKRKRSFVVRRSDLIGLFLLAAIAISWNSVLRRGVCFLGFRDEGT